MTTAMSDERTQLMRGTKCMLSQHIFSFETEKKAWRECFIEATSVSNPSFPGYNAQLSFLMLSPRGAQSAKPAYLTGLFYGKGRHYNKLFTLGSQDYD